MKLSYVTTNAGKVRSLQRDTERHGISVVQVDMDIPEPRSSDVEEVACEKVLHAYRDLHKPVVVLDAGFYVPSLNGFPRTFVNFALETIDLEGILTLVDGKDRQCEFKECLAYMDHDLSEPVYFTDRVPGTLATEVRGEMRSGLWSRLALIFIPDGSAKTSAEMTPEEHGVWLKKSKRDNTASGRLFIDWFVTNRLP